MFANLTHDWQPGDLVVLGSWQSFGKTAFALNLVKYIIDDKEFNIAFYSLEHPESQLLNRFHITHGNLKLDKVHIDDTPGLSLSELCDRIRKLVESHQARLIVIDYIELIHVIKTDAFNYARNLSRQQELNEISRTLRNLAEELRIIVVAITQMHRGILHLGLRNDRQYRPSLSDLEKYSSISNDANHVVFIYRPELVISPDNSEERSKAEIIIAKNVYGKSRTIHMRYIEHLMKFELDKGA